MNAVGAHTHNGRLFFILHDGSTISCDCIGEPFAQQVAKACNEHSHEPARTLGAYAVALLHGAELLDFERQNLIDLAASVGATVSPSHLETASRVARAREEMQKELSKLRNEAKERRSLWKRIFG